MRLVNWRALVLGAAGFGLAACGDDVTVTTPPINFTTSPSTGATCSAGGSTSVGVTVSGGSGTPTVTFTALNSNITVTGSGTSATVNCVTAGGSAVNFTIVSGGQTVTGSIPVTVGTGTGNTSQVLAIQSNPASASLVPGGTTTITASVTLAQGAPAGTSTAATFTSGDTTIARVTTNANGTATVTAVNSAANVGKQVVITATSVANTNLKSFTTISIAPVSTVIQSLQVSPSAVQLSTGGTQQITPNVTLAAGAPAGTSTGVTYASSDTSIAKVSTTGLITAGSKAGTATITVASAAAPSVAQQVAVTVSTPNPVRLTIQSVEAVNAAGQQVTADPTNIVGRIVATLNLDPGSFSPDSVVATIGTQRVVCQRFTAQLANALRASLQSGSADFAPIQCNLNTAAFDTTSGRALTVNGNSSFNATVYYRPIGGGTGTSQTATISTPLTLNNASGFALIVSNTPTATQVANSGNATGQAVGPTGALWRAGTLNVTVLPVLFNRTGTATDSLQTLSVTLNEFNSPNGPLNGTVTAVATRQANGSFVATFAGASADTPGAGATAASPLSGVTSGAGGSTLNVSNVVGGNVTGAITYLTSNGVPIGAGANGATVYIDNQNPTPLTAAGQTFPASFLVLGGGSAFVNGSFAFADSLSLNAAQLATARADNGGVDRVSVQFQTSVNTATKTYTTTPSTSALGATQVSAGTTAYVVRTRLTDALGNAANSAPSSTTFGVDLAAPTFASITGPVINARTNTGQTINYVTLADNASGINAASALLVNATRLASAGNVSTGAAILACPLSAVQDSSTTLTRTCPTIGTGNPVSFNLNGYYTVSTQARDRANNVTGTDTRTFVIDFIPPTLQVVGGAPSLITRGQPVSFANFTATDNLDLIQGYSVLQYQGGAINLAFDGPALGTLFDQVLTTTATPTFTIPVFTGQVDTPDIGNNPFSGFIGYVLDAGLNLNNPGTSSLTGIQGNVFAGTGTSAAASPTFYNGTQQSTLTVNYGTGITQLTYGGNTSTTTASSAGITFALAGPTGTFVNPLTSVELRYLDPAINAYRSLGPLTGGSPSDNGTTRTYTYSGTYAPTAQQFLSTAPPGTVTLRAVGFRANGDAVASAPVTVTLVP